MMEVSLQVLGRSFYGLSGDRVMYKIRSFWCPPVHVTENGRGESGVVLVPGLRLIDCLDKVKKEEEISIVVEVWEVSSKDEIPFGIALVNIEELVGKSYLSPLMRNFQVVDLVKGCIVGSLFLKVGLSLIPSAQELLAIPEPYSGETTSIKSSAYFSMTAGASPALHCPPHVLEPSPQAPTKEDPRAPAPGRPAPPSRPQNVPHSVQQSGEAPRREEEIPAVLEKISVSLSSEVPFKPNSYSSGSKPSAYFPTTAARANTAVDIPSLVHGRDQTPLQEDPRTPQNRPAPVSITVSQSVPYSLQRGEASRRGEIPSRLEEEGMKSILPSPGPPGSGRRTSRFNWSVGTTVKRVNIVKDIKDGSSHQESNAVPSPTSPPLFSYSPQTDTNLGAEWFSLLLHKDVTRNFNNT